MNTSSFSLEDNILIYQEKQFKYKIRIFENTRQHETIDLYITADKKGIQARRIAKQLETFLRYSFFDIKILRLRYVLKKPKLENIINEVKKNEYQYYYVEMVSFISLIVSLVLYAFHAVEISSNIAAFGVLVNLITGVIAIVGMFLPYKIVGLIPTERIVLKFILFNSFVFGPIYLHPVIS